MKKTLLGGIVFLIFVLISCTNETTTQPTTTSASTTATTTTTTETSSTTGGTMDDFVRVEPFELTIYDPFQDDSLITPERSDFFATATIEDKASYDTLSDGDLWPMAWSDDDYIYTANGDGKGFDLNSYWQDIVFNRVSGHVDTFDFRGTRINPSTSISQIWAPPTAYNRKPTGMLSVDGILYMAVQDLNKAGGPGIFNDAPNATIIRSNDKGQTWVWNTETAMFTGYKFTTVMFLDYGKDSTWNTFDDYVYAYGLDYNWRDSFSNSVPDPQKLFLARMPKTGIQDLSTWEFYTGDLNGNPSWSDPGDISAKQPVLQDEHRVYTNRIVGMSESMSVLSQGSIVYNKYIDRYIYSSWTEYTFEFYEAPTPWGPWRHFYQKDFGPYTWQTNLYGGYATIIPSKLISSDGLTMWVQSNTFAGGVHKYNLSLRKLQVTLQDETTPTNVKSVLNLAHPEIGSNATAIALASDLGLGTKIQDGRNQTWDKSFNELRKTYDYWGITWNQEYNMNQVKYVVGNVYEEGGWFEKVKVQVRRGQTWYDVDNLYISSNYTHDATVESFSEVVFKFDETHGDGVRIIGIPGGSEYYTSCSEFEVYYMD
ncbi:MAG: hypothetical protein JXB20_06865 [Bacilli bacterium]|nr:hypothetical protein [Bacilli bacterium]